jgi:quinolinate synthase
MSKDELRQKIAELKKAKDAVILVHNYQIPEIQEIADFFGDSLELAKRAAELDTKTIVFCGVHFMAETAKILSPDKMVLLPRKDAGCPMADMADAESLRKLKKKYPDAKVVTYVNTTAEVKAESDVCCTSANAVKVVQNVEADQIIFVPDRNLANYVSRFVDKEIIPWDGYCYVHQKMNPADVVKAKQMYPGAKVIVHPECTKEVVNLADEVLSTSGMIRFARSTDAKVIIVGTEEGLLYRLEKENPDKTFYTLGPARQCHDMKLNTLNDVYLALKEEQYKIEVPEQIRERAKIALNRMLEYI